MRCLYYPLLMFAPDASAGGSLEIVDYARLDDLSLTLEDGLEEVIDTYLEDTPALVGGMRAACASGDWPELQRMAHSVKSSSGIFGAHQMVALCRTLETAAGEQSPRCSSIIEEIAAAFAPVASELAAYIHTHSDPGRE